VKISVFERLFLQTHCGNLTKNIDYKWWFCFY